MTLEGKIVKILRPSSGNFSFSQITNAMFICEVDKKTVLMVGDVTSIFVGEYIEVEGEEFKNKSSQGGYFKISTMKPNFDSMDAKKAHLRQVLGQKVKYEKARSNILKVSNRTFKSLDEADEFVCSFIIKQLTSGNIKNISSLFNIKQKASKNIVDRWNKTFHFYMFWDRLIKGGIPVGMKDAAKIYFNPKFRRDLYTNTERLFENPYELLMVINIGFDQIDNIFAKNKGSATDARRIEGAVIGALQEELNGQGNNYTVYKELEQHALKLLNGVSKPVYFENDVPQALVHQAVCKLIKDKVIKHTKGTKLYLDGIFNKEEYIRNYITKNFKRYIPFDKEEWIKGYEEEHGISFGVEQKKAIINSMSNKLSIITGGAGTGKTSTLACVISCLRKTGIKVDDIALAAPTGKAAKRMMESIFKALGEEFVATTIHVLLKPVPGSFEMDEEKFEYNEKVKLNQKVFIVDETSMLDYNIAYAFLSALPSDAKVIFLGDTEQLQPVKNGFFLRDMIESHVAHVELKEVHRQAGDSAILKVAVAIRNETLNDTYLSLKAPDFAFKDLSSKAFDDRLDFIVDTFVRSVAKVGLDETMVLSPIKRVNPNKPTLNTKTINNAVQAKLLPDKSDEVIIEKNGEKFKIGSKVIIKKNNNELGVVNGDIGYIVDIDVSDGEFVVRLDDNRGDVVIGGEDLNHIQLAYAITVHSSQGSEWKNCIYCCFDETMMNKKALVYTAVTRAKKALLIVGTSKTFINSIHNKDVKKNSTIFNA